MRSAAERVTALLEGSTNGRQEQRAADDLYRKTLRFLVSAWAPGAWGGLDKL